MRSVRALLVVLVVALLSPAAASAHRAWRGPLAHAAGGLIPNDPGRVLDARGEGDSSTIAKGVRFAAKHGAQIINLSLEFSSDVTASQIPSLIKAIHYAHSKGALVVAASGNEAYTAVAYPARATFVLSVGATTEHGCLADYSNQGRGLDLVAPGGGADAVLPGDPNC